MKNITERRRGLRTWIEIDQGAIKNNYSVFRKLIGQRLLMGVVKSNAYGHDLVTFSKALNRLGVDYFGVDSIVEGNALRRSGIKKPVLVLGYTLPERILEAVKGGISITIADFDSLEAVMRLSKKIVKQSEKLKIHIKIDTGMHRQGFFLEDIPRLLEALKSINNIKIEGIYTHFSSAKDPVRPKETLKQIYIFKKVIDQFKKSEYKDLIKHSNASSGTLIFPHSNFDMVRIGIGLCGLWPSKETEKNYKNKITLKPVLSWKTIVSQIKNLPKGSRVGYDLTENVKKQTRIAILPIGYWHGFPRALSSRGFVLINGKKAKVIGRVSMDMIAVNVSGIKGVKVGDEVVLIGKSGESVLPVETMAELSDSTSYEIITRLNPLIKRIFY
ncbi:MAG: alanine racemase [Minisyncoccia bacterium]